MPVDEVSAGGGATSRVLDAQAMGYDVPSFEAGWQAGYRVGVLEQMQGREVVRATSEPEPVQHRRLVPLGVAVQAAKAAGVREWRPGRVVLYAALLVAAVLILAGGLTMIFGRELLAAGLTQVWSWWIQPG